MLKCLSCHREMEMSSGAIMPLKEMLEKAPNDKFRVSLRCPHCGEKTTSSISEIRRYVSSRPEVQKRSLEAPPSPPKLNWTQLQKRVDENTAEDPNVALVCAPNLSQSAQSRIHEVLAKFDYYPTIAHSSTEAIRELNNFFCQCVIVADSFERDIPFAETALHKHILAMPQEVRRQMLYIVIGPKMRTLYTLQAISLSANIVMSEEDINYDEKNRFEVIFRQAIRSLERTFGTVIQLEEPSNQR